eukprot:4888611-Prorocentrum_lima.AAC.2
MLTLQSVYNLSVVRSSIFLLASSPGSDYPALGNLETIPRCSLCTPPQSRSNARTRHPSMQ